MGRNRSNPVSVIHADGAICVFQFPFPIASAYTYTYKRASFRVRGDYHRKGDLRARGRGRFLSRGEDHSVHRRHLIASLSHLALPHKLNDRLNGWPSRYAKERFFGYFAKYPVKDFDGPLRFFHASQERPRRAGRLGRRNTSCSIIIFV